VFPLRDLNPTRSVPVLTYLLIAANAVVFFHEITLDPAQGEEFVFRWGMVPYFLTQDVQIGSLATPFTSMFIHGGWLHLLGNMWFLHIFGDNVEDALGRGRYLLFFVLCGLLAAVGQTLIDPQSKIPMVGASGAIAGVLGAYYRLFPKARIVTLIPIFFFMMVRELPAVFFIVLWFVMQLLEGFGSLGQVSQGGGVAFFAHIGGFLGGLLLINVFGGPRSRTGGFSRRGHTPNRSWDH
jgi:hypothetical protein